MTAVVDRARAEAERLRPVLGVTDDLVRRDNLLWGAGFASGAEWQASQPVTVSAEQVAAHRIVGHASVWIDDLYIGPGVVCACSPGSRYLVEDYPAHLIAALGIEVAS